MREELLALEEKLRNNIYEFAKENSNKSVEEILTMLGIKEYTLKDSVYHFTSYEIDTNDLVHIYKKAEQKPAEQLKKNDIPTGVHTNSLISLFMILVSSIGLALTSVIKKRES